MDAKKYSGVKWIGRIPEEWSIGRISHRYDLALGKMVEPDAGDSERKQYPYLCAANIKWDGVDINVCKKMYFSASERLQYEVKRGDLLITEGGSVGTSCIYKEEFGPVCYMQNSVIRARSQHDGSNAFLRHWLEFVVNSGYLEALCNKATISHYTKDKVGKTPLVLLEDSEASTIAMILDRECAKIEAIASMIEKQIEVLERYRASVIHEAVTRGLDPTVPTKPSGVNWIGNIPENWDVTPLGYLGSFQNGISKDGDSFGEGYPFVSYGDVYSNRSLPATVKGLVKSNTDEQFRYSVKKGDVFFTRTSETASEIAFASTCFSTIEKATFAGFLIRFRPNGNRLNPRYGSYYFRNNGLRNYFVKEMMIVTRASLGQQLLKKLPVLIPSIDEQERIADYLDARTTAIDAVLETKRKQLDILKRRRQSLIYEYVTGKRRVTEEA